LTLVVEHDDETKALREQSGNKQQDWLRLYLRLYFQCAPFFLDFTILLVPGIAVLSLGKATCDSCCALNSVGLFLNWEQSKEKFCTFKYSIQLYWSSYILYEWVADSPPDDMSKCLFAPGFLCSASQSHSWPRDEGDPDTWTVDAIETIPIVLFLWNWFQLGHQDGGLQCNYTDHNSSEYWYVDDACRSKDQGVTANPQKKKIHITPQLYNSSMQSWSKHSKFNEGWKTIEKKLEKTAPKWRSRKGQRLFCPRTTLSWANLLESAWKGCTLFEIGKWIVKMKLKILFNFLRVYPPWCGDFQRYRIHVLRNISSNLLW